MPVNLFAAFHAFNPPPPPLETIITILKHRLIPFPLSPLESQGETFETGASDSGRTYTAESCTADLPALAFAL
jgi:hypothetical protein